ncbi:MAG: carboxypeptidase-like regulatory domain-containing protein [Bacteroidetes bacterium]|nr:carboxypeptidase-like regulatory domain-containing protein [Bacteroidota bacterium]
MSVSAQQISGKILGQDEKPLPFASITLKNSGRGVTSNEKGIYSISLPPGEYILIAQYVGYTRVEKKVKVNTQQQVIDFTLSPLTNDLSNVIISTKDEDPAYEIIRHAIAKRKEYQNPLDSFTTEAYIKTWMKSRKLPTSILGQKMDVHTRKEMGVDSMGKGMIYLSESISHFAYRKPNEQKLEVISGRESGSNGYGFNFPVFINFYDNNVNVLTDQFAPRGYVSPIADNALTFYKYHYLGSFFEEGKEIHEIAVKPKRNYEPLFTGTIYITEGDWRIHSLNLLLTKSSQLEILDTLSIKQINGPVTKDIWRTKNQAVYFTLNVFGADIVGNFINQYNNYDLHPVFAKNYFNNVIVRYDTAVNKKSSAYWDSIRPIPLLAEEQENYHTKDSIFRTGIDSMFSRNRIDSLRKAQARITLKNVFWNGFKRSNFDPLRPSTFQWKPLLPNVSYNTVEGFVSNISFTAQRQFPKSLWSFTPVIRYGFHNKHLNSWASLTWKDREISFAGNADLSKNTLVFSGGKRVSQLYRDCPLLPINSLMGTLFYNRNYLKIDENYFGEIYYHRKTENGLQLSFDLLYEDRLPLENTTDFAIINYSSQKFTPNYPIEKINQNFPRHQAFVAGIELKYQPGQKYIQFPNYKFSLGSKAPVFQLNYQKGIPHVFGSDEDFDKWNLAISDQFNFHLGGEMIARVDVGGFLNDRVVYIQDYQHFNGHKILFVTDYENTFLNALYYANSTTAPFYSAVYLQHHFNGALTNKIPFFKKLNWNLVAGANGYYAHPDNTYFEVFGGIENILKILRVDIGKSFGNGLGQPLFYRVGLSGLIGSKITFGKK